MHDTHRTGANFLANRAASGQHRTDTLELVALLGLALGLAFHGFRTRLQDVHFAVDAVLAPLDIHRTAVMVFNNDGITCQLLDIGVGQRITVAQLNRHIGRFDQLAADFFLFCGRELHLQQLGAQIPADHRTVAGLEHRLVNIELVRVHSTLHHRFTQPIAGSHKHHVFKTAFSVDGEHHTGRTQVTAHHALHAGRQGDARMGKPLVDAVADGAVVVERSKHFFHLVQHVVNADNIQKGFLLAGKRGVRQVFGGGR